MHTHRRSFSHIWRIRRADERKNRESILGIDKYKGRDLPLDVEWPELLVS